MIVTAIVLALLAALLDYFVGINEPWRKIIFIGIVILFVVGVIVLLLPGLIPLRLGLH